MKPKIYLYGTSGQYGNYLAALTEAGAEPGPVPGLRLRRAAAARRRGHRGHAGGHGQLSYPVLCRQRPPHSGHLPGDAGTERLFRRHAPRPHPRTPAGAGRSDPPHTGQRTAFAAAGAGSAGNQQPPSGGAGAGGGAVPFATGGRRHHRGFLP